MTTLPNISFASLASEPQAGTVIYFAATGEDLPASLQKLDQASGGVLSKAMQVADFKRKRKSVIEILAPHGLAAGRLLIAGVGDQKTLNAQEWMDIGGAVRGKLHAKAREADAVFLGLEPLTEEAPLAFALGFGLRSYAFKKYKSKAAPKGDETETPEENNGAVLGLNVFSQWGESLERTFQRQLAVCQSIYFARDLVNEPANVLTPPEFTSRLKALEAEGLKVEVLGESELKSLGMNALLSVGQGSSQPSSAVILRLGWNGRPEQAVWEPRLCGQGRLLRLRRHFAEARPGHGGHEGRHGRGGGGRGSHADACAQKSAGEGSGACRPG